MNANVSIYQDSVKDSSGILTSESNEMGLSTIFNYNGNNVAFIKTSYGILINATDMARPYNKRPVDYLRQIYVNELVSTIVSQTHISEDQLVIKMRGSSENGGGTWLYEDVAIDFAQWLDVKFKVWCNSKIKELLTTGLVKLPNFNNPPEAARAWADEYEARMKAEKEVRLALEAKEKIEKEKRMVQAELNTAIDTIKENEPVIDMFKRSIPREGVLIRESSKYFEQFGYYIGIKNMYPLLQELKYVFRNERGRIEAYQSARNSGLVTYGSDPGDEYWEAKAVTVLVIKTTSCTMIFFYLRNSHVCLSSVYSNFSLSYLIRLIHLIKFLYPIFFNCSSVAFSFGNFPCHLPGTTTSRPSGLVASLPHSLHSPMPLYGCSSLAYSNLSTIYSFVNIQ